MRNGSWRYLDFHYIPYKNRVISYTSITLKLLTDRTEKMPLQEHSRQHLELIHR